MIPLALPHRVVEAPSSHPALSRNVEKAVEEIWQAQRARHPALFNGKIFAVEKVGADQVTGQFVDYRLFLAQLRRPDLFTDLQIEALAVTGVLIAEGGIVWARRGPNSTQYPGIWELVPSGGVDDKSRMANGHLDLHRQILSELEEETGLGKEAIEQIRPNCFIHDAKNHLYHFVFEIRTSLSMIEIVRLQSALPGPEHSELALVPFDQLETFSSQQPPEFAQLTRTILCQLNLVS